MAAIEVQHISLKAGDLKAHALIFTLLGHLLVVSFIDYLVCPLSRLLEQIVCIADYIIPANIGTMDNIICLLVCLPYDIFAHTLSIYQGRLQHIAVRLIALHFPGKTLVLCFQIGNLLTQAVKLLCVCFQLLLYLIKETIYVLCAVTTEALFELRRMHILRCKHGISSILQLNTENIQLSVVLFYFFRVMR